MGADSSFRKAVFPPLALLGTRVSVEVWCPCMRRRSSSPIWAQKPAGGSDGSQSLWCFCSHWRWQMRTSIQLFAQENKSCKFAVCFREWWTKSAVDRKSSENHTQDWCEVTEKNPENPCWPCQRVCCLHGRGTAGCPQILLLHSAAVVTCWRYTVSLCPAPDQPQTAATEAQKGLFVIWWDKREVRHVRGRKARSQALCKKLGNTTVLHLCLASASQQGREKGLSWFWLGYS